MEIKDVLQSVVGRAKAKGVQFADARAVIRDSTAISRQDGRAEKLFFKSSEGIGVRVLVNGAWGFASKSGLDFESAISSLESAISLAKASAPSVSDPGKVAEIDPVEGSWKSPSEIDPSEVSMEEKMRFLEWHENIAREKVGDRTANSVFSYTDSVSEEIVCNTFGTLVDSKITRVQVFARITAKEGEIRETGSEQIGRLAGFEAIKKITPEEFSLKAANEALDLLKAEPAPAGKMPVIFHPSVTGLFVHEALGHNAEADHIYSGSSIIGGKLGEVIASELVTIVDDGTVENAWGSYKWDSEGTPSAKRVIIENGKLVGYLHSLETAARLGMAPNGSARADGYSSRPIVRMSNTYIAAGNHSLEELISGTDLGVLLEGFQYGYVMCERGQFTCHVSKGTMIRGGKIAETVRDMSVSGSTLDVLKNIDGVSREFEMRMAGTCGKNGQGVPTDAGGPYIRVREMVVGGTRQV